MAGPRTSPQVSDGQPAAFQFDGRLTWLWSGQNDDGLDVLAAAGSHLLTFQTAAECRAACAEPRASAWSPFRHTTRPPTRAEPTTAAGHLLLLGPEHLREPASPQHPGESAHGSVPDPQREAALVGSGAVRSLASGGEPLVTDLGPAQEWAAGRRLAVPAESALDLWNLGIEVARSTGRPFVQRGVVRDACYHKLVASQVPWMFDRDSYRPTWQPAQLTALRGTLNDAVHLIRAALR